MATRKTSVATKTTKTAVKSNATKTAVATVETVATVEMTATAFYNALSSEVFKNINIALTDNDRLIKVTPKKSIVVNGVKRGTTTNIFSIQPSRHTAYSDHITDSKTDGTIFSVFAIGDKVGDNESLHGDKIRKYEIAFSSFDEIKTLLHKVDAMTV